MRGIGLIAVVGFDRVRPATIWALLLSSSCSECWKVLLPPIP